MKEKAYYIRHVRDRAAQRYDGLKVTKKMISKIKNEINNNRCLFLRNGKHNRVVLQCKIKNSIVCFVYEYKTDRIITILPKE